MLSYILQIQMQNLQKQMDQERNMFYENQQKMTQNFHEAVLRIEAANSSNTTFQDICGGLIGVAGKLIPLLLKK